MGIMMKATVLAMAATARAHSSSGSAVAAGGEDITGLTSRKLMDSGSDSAYTECAKTYQQCGGRNAESRDCCNDDDICKLLNPFYAQCVPDPDGPTDGCAVRYDVCGGRFSEDRDCCRKNDECVFINDFYSQCQPPMPHPPGGKAPGEKCTKDSECESDICDGDTGRCNFPCDPSLQQEEVDGECTCQDGFIDVNNGDGTFCASLCELSQMPCSEDGDCCDSNVNVSCKNKKCTVDPGKCGSNQSRDAKGDCQCNEGFINVASNNMGIEAPDPFCVPNCTVTGNSCTGDSSCCSQFGKVGFCMIIDGESEGICALTPSGPTTARIASEVEVTEVEEVPQTAVGVFSA